MFHHMSGLDMIDTKVKTAFKPVILTNPPSFLSSKIYQKQPKPCWLWHAALLRDTTSHMLLFQSGLSQKLLLGKFGRLRLCLPVDRLYRKGTLELPVRA